MATNRRLISAKINLQPSPLNGPAERHRTGSIISVIRNIPEAAAAGWRGSGMTSVGSETRRRAAMTSWIWLSAACFGGLAPGHADAQVRMAQAESEGGSMGGSILPAHKPSRPRVQPRTEQERRPSPRLGRRSEEDGLTKFDGTWSVSSGGGCPSAGNAQVRIAHGRIIAANGNGRVGSDGSVSTVSTVAGMTVVGQGRIVGNAASGSYRQSDGCVGPWSAVRL